MIPLLFAALLAAADAGTQTAPIAPPDSAPDIVPLVPPPAESTLSLKDGDFRVRVNLRPGEPQPGAVVGLRFDVGHGDSDVGEPRPFSGAKLALTVTGPGPKLRYLVRPLGDAGAYGVHWTPPHRGLWTLSLAPWSEAGPGVSFQVGAGETMPPSSRGRMVQDSAQHAPGELKASTALLPGDARNAQKLYRLHCLACHGATGEPAQAGEALHAPMLKDPALIAGRADDQLISLFREGTRSHPAPGSALSLLDAADLVAFLRAGLPSIGDLFPDAAAYTAKTYALQGPALTRAESLAGDELKPDERALTVFSVYTGDPPPEGPRLVPQDPVLLDALSPKAKRGYVIFGWLSGVPVALALAPDFSVAKLLSPSKEIAKAAPAVVGKGGREPGRRKPFVSRAAPDAARALTRLYARAAEGAALAAREEADRHLFDAPEKRASP